jgi:MSHA biogenesis protein MshL
MTMRFNPLPQPVWLAVVTVSVLNGCSHTPSSQALGGRKPTDIAAARAKQSTSTHLPAPPKVALQTAPPQSSQQQKTVIPSATAVSSPSLNVPLFTDHLPLVAPLIARSPQETYHLMVHQIPVAELLLALSREAKLNIDLHPNLTGTVSLNAINQTLPQLLARIAEQAPIAWEWRYNTLMIRPDKPVLRQYQVDYVNIERDANSKVSIATQIATTGGITNTGGNGATSFSGGFGGGGTHNNHSGTSVSNVANNHFWDSLVKSIKAILRETDQVLPAGSGEIVTETDANGYFLPQSARTYRGVQQSGGASGRQTHAANHQGVNALNQSAPQLVDGTTTSVIRQSTYLEAGTVIAHPESGVLAVRATQRQHERIRAFIDDVLRSARRQVLIEATVVEVQLNEQYQQGVNWQLLKAQGAEAIIVQQPTGQITGNDGLFSGATAQGAASSVLNVRYGRTGLFGTNLSAALNLLRSFGEVKVLSSPRISALNNQTALLKVVDNKVYFTVSVQTIATQGAGTQTVYATQANTIPVGFVMSITPQIDPVGQVTLNVRPTISRVIGYVNDPNPALAQNNVTSRIPEIQTRELESVLKVQHGQIAVMGGLMQDADNLQRDEVPVLADLKGVGSAFQYRNNKQSKSELVIFLRPVVIRQPSITHDYHDYAEFLR